MKKTIAITKGDGVGQEVVPEGVKILKVINDYTELELKFMEAPAGGAIWKESGNSLPNKSFQIITDLDQFVQ